MKHLSFLLLIVLTLAACSSNKSHPYHIVQLKSQNRTVYDYLKYSEKSCDEVRKIARKLKVEPRAIESEINVLKKMIPQVPSKLPEKFYPKETQSEELSEEE